MNPRYLDESPELLKEFLLYIETIKGKSEKTVEGYFIDLRTFLRFMKRSKRRVENSVPLEEISISDIDVAFLSAIALTDLFEFMNHVKSVRGNDARTRARKTSAIRGFFGYLTNKAGYLKNNPAAQLELPKLKKTLPKYLTLEQCMELLSNIDGEFAIRDRCILTLFLNCGLRLSELATLNVTDISPDGSMTVTGKGNKQRSLYLNQACVNALTAYLKVRPVDGVKDRRALFISRNKNRMSKRTIQLMVQKSLERIGIMEGYSVHKLRHTAATLMYRHGKTDIRTLQQVLGHDYINSTQIYTHVANEQVKEAIESNPLAKM